MDIKPRVDTGILLSVGSNSGGDFLALQLFEGSVRLTVDSGEGPETLSLRLENNRTMCDGHWHKIKVNSVMTEDGNCFAKS